MKKIVHFKFDPKETRFDEVDKASKYLKAWLPDYTVLLTPYDVTFEDENDLALSLNGINYTHKQLEEMLDKANMYDGLCE